MEKLERYHFLKFELHEDWIYVVEENNLFRPQEEKEVLEALEEYGFSYVQYNNFLIYTYQQ